MASSASASASSKASGVQVAKVCGPTWASALSAAVAANSAGHCW